jgi:hypothetical protein
MRIQQSYHLARQQHTLPLLLLLLLLLLGFRQR